MCARGTLILLLGAAGALAIGCGDARPAAPVATPAVRLDATPTQIAVPYLLDHERVTPVARRVRRTRAVAGAAVRALLAGPTAAERDAGLTTAVPDGTRLLGLTVRDGVATVDLTKRFGSGGGSLSMLARVAQVVHTLTRFSTVQRVAFRLDGRPVSTIGGEGIIVAPPVDRADFEDLAPIILVESPLRGRRVRSPFAVRGTSNTFEASLTVDLLGPDGARLARRHPTATSGSGTRGSFTTVLRFDAKRGAALMLVAYERSAADNRIVHAVRIPLVAGRVGKDPASRAAVAAALVTARGRYPDARVAETLRSALDRSWSLVTGRRGRRGLWAAWVRRIAGVQRVEIFRARDFRPGRRPPCDIRPAFSEPAC